MKWPKWSIASNEPHDFLPIMIGCIFLLVSLPAFVLLLAKPDQNSGALAIGLLIWFAVGIIAGVVFVIFGLRIYSSPGSLVYRITHGRFLSR